jgi:hypothetical protein
MARTAYTHKPWNNKRGATRFQNNEHVFAGQVATHDTIDRTCLASHASTMLREWRRPNQLDLTEVHPEIS